MITLHSPLIVIYTYGKVLMNKPSRPPCLSGETGRRTGLRIQRNKIHVGSIPILDTK